MDKMKKIHHIDIWNCLIVVTMMIQKGCEGLSFIDHVHWVAPPRQRRGVSAKARVLVEWREGPGAEFAPGEGEWRGLCTPGVNSLPQAEGGN